MRRNQWGIALALVGALAIAGCSSMGGGGGSEPHTVLVTFDNMMVSPKNAKVPADATVTWANQSTDYVASIAFPKSITGSFTCTDMRPDWMEEAENLVSMPIRGGSMQLVTPCPLKPGTYPYQIWLADRWSNLDNPQLTLKGSLIVE